MKKIKKLKIINVSVWGPPYKRYDHPDMKVIGRKINEIIDVLNSSKEEGKK